MDRMDIFDAPSFSQFGQLLPQNFLSPISPTTSTNFPFANFATEIKSANKRSSVRYSDGVWQLVIGNGKPSGKPLWLPCRGLFRHRPVLAK